jgi:hypothetical protein
MGLRWGVLSEYGSVCLSWIAVVYLSNIIPCQLAGHPGLGHQHHYYVCVSSSVQPPSRMDGRGKAVVRFRVISENGREEKMTKQGDTGRLHKASSNLANMREAGDGQ